MEQNIVLQLFGEPMNCGGQEAFIMNMYRSIDRSMVQFHFYTPFDFPNLALRREIEDLGGKAFWGDGAFESRRRKYDLVVNTERFLREHSYTTAHIHSGSSFNLALMAALCRHHGIQRIIVHSHCTGIDNLTHRVSKALFAPILDHTATGFLACSTDAARWRFSEQAIQGGRFSVLRNGIDTGRFRFSDELRVAVRKEWNIPEDSPVICNTGRCTVQKNQLFALDVFAAFLKRHPDAFFLLAGDGELREEIEKKIEALGITHQVKLLGNRSDIPAILSASDAFLFPSIFEGLGISAVEAQCSGLRTVCTDNLPKELTVSPILTRCSLSDSLEHWAAALEQCIPVDERDTYPEIVKAAGYDALSSADHLMHIYCHDHFNESPVSV